MKTACTITLEENPDPAEVAAIRDGLAAFNRTAASDGTFTRLTLVVRAPDGKVAGGLIGGTYWGWLYVEDLWLSEEYRGQDLGSQLLACAEQAARERGCYAVHLDTMDFQAPGFYEKQGYTVWGVLENIPRGHRRIFYKKDLE